MNGRYVRLGALLTLIVVLVIGWFAVVSPQRDDANAVSAQITSAQQNLANLTAQTASGAATRRQVRKARRDVRHLRRALPRSYAEPALINTLQRQAVHSHVDFQGLTFTASTTTATASTTSSTPGAVSTTGLQPLAFSLSIAGHYFAIARFVARLQNMTGSDGHRVWVTGRLLAFTGISLAAEHGRAGTALATITGDAYLLPISAVPAAARVGAAS